MATSLLITHSLEDTFAGTTTNPRRNLSKDDMYKKDASGKLVLSYQPARVF